MTTKTIIAASVTLLFWSSAFAGIRASLAGGYTPGHLVLLRFLSASLVFVLYALFRGVKLPRPRDILPIALLGWTGITIYHTALTFGELWVQAGTASLIIAAAPALTAILAMIVLKEGVSPIGWLGIALGFAGIGLITLGSSTGGGYLKGVTLICVSAVATAFFFVYQKPLLKRYSAIDLTAYFTWFGTLPLFVFLPGFANQVRQVPLGATLSGIYIGVFPAAVAYAAWAIALSSASAAQVSSALYLNPVLAIVIAWIWLHELPHPVAILGGVIVVLGVVIVNLSKQRARELSKPSTNAPTA